MDRYADEFARYVCNKTQGWANEKETRILLMDRENLLPNKCCRLLEYRFDDLKGIIFGMRMTETDRRRIRDIIIAKCLKTDRTDIVFKAAYYCHNTGQLKAVGVGQHGQLLI